MAGEKTEKPTPKRRDEARKKGTVARSTDLNGAVVMMAGLMALTVMGPAIAERLGQTMRELLALGANHEVVSQHGIGTVLLRVGRDAGMAILPVAAACAIAALVVCVAQVGFKPHMPKVDPKRLNPLTGAKNIFGPNALVELLKSLSKVGVIGAIVFAAVIPKIDDLALLVGIQPIELGIALSENVRSIFLRAGVAYLVVGLADLMWQRYRTEKSMKMDMHEVKEEHKQQAVPAEVRSAMRRRQMAASRARMMSAIPEADVVVTNPTHFSVALRYEGSMQAPEVVAKGQDLLALRIREIAAQHGVPVVPEPPLARSLYSTVEVGQQIPEDLFQAVAQVLAFVYRVSGRTRRAA